MYMGGDQGDDRAVLVHRYGEMVPASTRVGSHGSLFAGGTALAKAAFDGDLYGPGAEEEGQDWFKFFFNYMEMSSVEINDINAEIKRASEGGEGARGGKDTDTDGGAEAGGSPFSSLDGWLCLEVDDPEIVLRTDYGRGDCWRLLRNKSKALVEEWEGANKVANEAERF